MSEAQARVEVRDIELATRAPDTASPQRMAPLFLWGHGLMSSVAQEDALAIFDWSPVCAHARLVRYDARSHGDSDLDLDPPTCAGPNWPATCSGSPLRSGLRARCSGGISMGCATSLHAAVLAPDRVIGLVLVAPPTAWETRHRQARFYRIASTCVRWVASRRCGCSRRCPAPVPRARSPRCRADWPSSSRTADARAVATRCAAPPTPICPIAPRCAGCACPR